MVKTRIGLAGLPVIVLAWACMNSSTVYTPGTSPDASAGAAGTDDPCICDYKPAQDAGAPSETGTNTVVSGAGPQLCQWPAAFDPSDASAPGACRAAPALVHCLDGNGGGQICLSRDPTTCSESPEQPDATFDCKNQCATNEYAALCGSIGPGALSDVEIPTGCRMALATPGGVAFYCCPCMRQRR